MNAAKSGHSSSHSMNWPFIVRKLCLAYPGTTPADYENLTRDQLYIMMLPESTLKELCGTQTMSVNSAIQKGIIPSDKHLLGGYRSLAEKLNAEKKAKDELSKKSHRQARRELQKQEQEKRKDG